MKRGITIDSALINPVKEYFDYLGIECSFDKQTGWSTVRFDANKLKYTQIVAYCEGLHKGFGLRK